MFQIARHVALAAAALAAFAPAAAPAQGSFHFAVSVPAGDLNLASKAGQATLAGRVDAAADRMCSYGGVVPLREQLAAEACRSEFEKAARGLISKSSAGAGK